MGWPASGSNGDSCWVKSSAELEALMADPQPRASRPMQVHMRVAIGAVDLPRWLAGGVGQRRRRAVELGHEEDDPKLGHSRTTPILNRCSRNFMEVFLAISRDFPTSLIPIPMVG